MAKTTKTEEVKKNVSETKPKKVKAEKGRVLVYLNLRKQPDLESDVITVLKKEDIVSFSVIEGNKEWCSVKTESGEKGYCVKKYIEKIK